MMAIDSFGAQEAPIAPKPPIASIAPRTVPYRDDDDPATAMPEFVPETLTPSSCHAAALHSSRAIVGYLKDHTKMSDFQIDEISRVFYTDAQHKLVQQHSWLWQNLYTDAVNRGDLKDPRIEDD